MKEKMKTFLLISLVGISILFTKRLWIGLPRETVNSLSKESQATNNSYSLIDMITPNKYLLNFNEKHHTLFYDDSKYGLWTDIQSSLSKILDSSDINIVDLPGEEFLTYNTNRSIAFYFPEKVSTYILAKALNVKNPNHIVDTIPNIDSIYIYLGRGNPFFVFSYEDTNIAVYDPTIDISKIAEQVKVIESGKKFNYYYSMKEEMGTDKDIYVPYEMKNNLATIYVENEIRTLNERERQKLAEKFFNKDIDYIREIVESNGSNIYEYNQRVLKLNTNGSLEYFHPLEEDVKKRNLYESMSTAAEFISKYTGVPEGMHLAKIEEIRENDSLGYNLTFKYRIRGIPIILGNKEVVDFVEIEVFNNHIRSYKHFIRNDMKVPAENILVDKKMLSSFDVIDMNHDFIFEKYLKDNNINEEEINMSEMLSSIEDITLAYFDPCLKDIGDQLIGVWVIKTNDGLYAFDAYKGTLVYEES